MNKRKKKILFYSGIIFLILLFTNPTNSDFDHYIRAKGLGNSTQGGRTFYFIIGSFYEVNNNSHIIKSIGILKNFIIIQDKAKSPSYNF